MTWKWLFDIWFVLKQLCMYELNQYCQTKNRQSLQWISFQNTLSNFLFTCRCEQTFGWCLSKDNAVKWVTKLWTTLLSPSDQTNKQTKSCFQVPIQYFTFSDQTFSHTMWKDQVERSKSLILMWVSIPEKEWKETYLFWRLQFKITPPESQNIFWFWYPSALNFT